MQQAQLRRSGCPDLSPCGEIAATLARSNMPAQSAPTTSEPHSEERFDLADLLGYRLMRLSATVAQAADQDAADIARLSLPEYRVIAVLMSRGPLGVAVLQQIMMIDKAWISRTLSKLVEKKLAVARPEPLDGRRTTFSLSAKGRRSAQALIDQAQQRQNRILAGLDLQERTLLFELLGRIQLNVDALLRPE